MSDAVERVLDLFRQASKRGVTGVTRVTKPGVTTESSMVTAVTRVTPVTHFNRCQPTGYTSARAGAGSEFYDFDERAAIAIHDGGIPEIFGDAFAQLQIAQPIGVPQGRWLRAIDDAGRFLDRWGNVAAQLQWSAEDIFKLPAAPSLKTRILNLDSIGLCWALDGRSVIALDACSATIGDMRIFRRAVIDQSQFRRPT
jgi:hypothetical protein